VPVVARKRRHCNKLIDLLATEAAFVFSNVLLIVLVMLGGSWASGSALEVILPG